MAEKELGGSRAELPPTPVNTTPPVPIPSGSSSTASAEQSSSLTEVKKDPPVVPKELNDGSGGAGKKALSWGHILWNRWYWGLFLAVALALSRVTSSV